MSEFEAEMNRLADLDMAVRNYLSHLYAYEQGAEHDGAFVDHWREQLELLTDGEPFDSIGGDDE
jgi:hypothetical protein